MTPTYQSQPGPEPPATSLLEPSAFYQVADADDANNNNGINNNNNNFRSAGQKLNHQRRPLPVIHEESLFNSYL